MSDVQKHYSEVANNILSQLDGEAVVGASSCCDAPAKASEARFLYAQEALSQLPNGAVAASRGCGDPVAQADLQPGERVLDLGSGGGIDALIAAHLVGPEGHVFGVDMTESMIELATRNAADAHVGNVEFLQGAIENLPLEDESVDVVLSNCVINFSNDKPRVLREALRVLRPGGRLVVSDIVSYAPIADASYWPLCRIVGCTNGMQPATEYERMLKECGFAQVTLQPKTTYTREVLLKKAQQKDRMGFYEQLADDNALDGASGSVIIKAAAPR